MPLSHIPSLIDHSSVEAALDTLKSRHPTDQMRLLLREIFELHDRAKKIEETIQNVQNDVLNAITAPKEETKSKKW